MSQLKARNIIHLTPKMQTSAAKASLNHRKSTLTPKEVMGIVLDFYGVRQDAFVGRGRAKHVVRARQAYAWLCRQRLPESFPELAAAVKAPNHSTMITRRNAALKRKASDPEFATELRTLDQIVLAQRLRPGQAQPYLVEQAAGTYPLEGGAE